MSKAVYKYTLNVTDKQTLVLPFKAQLLCVQAQNNVPVLYAKVDLSDSLVEKRYFHTFGTGHLIKSMLDSYLNYVGTYQLNEGRLVFHVFEELLEECLDERSTTTSPSCVRYVLL